MQRFFLRVAYKGNPFSGSQVQENASTVQQELERALGIFLRQQVGLTGSSRTDAGVHARENFFHFDLDPERLAAGHPWLGEGGLRLSMYNLNAILAREVVVLGIYPVQPGAHCRFDAVGREYRYYVYREKDPFLEDRAYYFPYSIDIESLNMAAGVVGEGSDFAAFSKRGAQHRTSLCQVDLSRWESIDNMLVYTIRANRFLRGMVRGLVGTMLLVGRGRVTVEGFRHILESRDAGRVDFSAPGHGLFLERVYYPQGLLEPRVE